MFFKKKKKLSIKIAYIISRVSDVFVWFLVLGVALICSDHLNGYNRFGWAVGLMAFFGLLPLFFLWLGLKKGVISDIDFTKREERTPYLLVILFFWVIGSFLVWSFAGPKIVFDLLIIVILLAVAVLIINLYWKISNHTLTITAVSLIINQLFGWQYFWLLLIIPIVAWSRWIQKKHTLSQLAGGTGLGILAWIALILFGY
jgi:membrane-associated phospholipid phosphatase